MLLSYAALWETQSLDVDRRKCSYLLGMDQDSPTEAPSVLVLLFQLAFFGTCTDFFFFLVLWVLKIVLYHIGFNDLLGLLVFV